MTTVAVPTVFCGREPARLLAGILSTPVFDFAHLNAFEEFGTQRFGLGFQVIRMEILRPQLKAVTYLWPLARALVGPDATQIN